jgi:hypothetical protein
VDAVLVSISAMQLKPSSIPRTVNLLPTTCRLQNRAFPAGQLGVHGPQASTHCGFQTRRNNSSCAFK